MFKNNFTQKPLISAFSLATVFLAFITSAWCHDRSYEMTVENWLEKTPNIIKNKQGVYTAKCRKRYSGQATKILHQVGIATILPRSWMPFDEAYYEVILTHEKDSEVLGAIHFNRHFWSRGDKYSISIWGWFNTLGIRTSEQDLIWHGKPWAYRWNSWSDKEQVITSDLFETIAKDGQFTLLTENNPIRWGQGAVEAVIKIKNPEELKKCFG